MCFCILSLPEVVSVREKGETRTFEKTQPVNYFRTNNSGVMNKVNEAKPTRPLSLQLTVAVPQNTLRFHIRRHPQVCTAFRLYL